MLTALACVYVELGHARIEIPQLSPYGEVIENPHVESQAHLEYSRASSSFTRVDSTKFELGLFAEMPKACAKAEPWRKPIGRKQVGANGWSNKIRTVAFWNEILFEM